MLFSQLVCPAPMQPPVGNHTPVTSILSRCLPLFLLEIGMGLPVRVVPLEAWKGSASAPGAVPEGARQSRSQGARQEIGWPVILRNSDHALVKCQHEFFAANRSLSVC